MNGAASDKPLQGFTLLDLGGMGPSARCTRLLADLGARWIRLLAPASGERVRPGAYDYGALRGAELMELDLKAPGGADVFLQMARRADIIVESFRPGVARRLGISYPDVQVINARIIYCASTGYGQDGPYAGLAGHDLNYQALSGALAAVGRTDSGLPAMPGLTLADSAGGGWQAVIRILGALLAREASGQGAFIDAAAAEGVLHLMAGAIDDHLGRGSQPRDGLFAGRYACYNVYRAADGKALAVAALEPKFFVVLCEALERPGLATLQYDAAAQVELKVALSEIFAQRPQAAWVELLGDKDACVTPVLEIEEVVSDPHWISRDMIEQYQHPAGGATRQLAAFGRGQPDDRGAVPVLTTPDAILESLDFDSAEIHRLKHAHIVG